MSSFFHPNEKHTVLHILVHFVPFVNVFFFEHFLNREFEFGAFVCFAMLASMGHNFEDMVASIEIRSQLATAERELRLFELQLCPQNCSVLIQSNKIDP